MAHALSRLVGRLEDQSGSIVGEDVNGLARPCTFSIIRTSFRVYDYDDVAPGSTRSKSSRFKPHGLSIGCSQPAANILIFCGENDAVIRLIIAFGVAVAVCVGIIYLIPDVSRLAHLLCGKPARQPFHRVP